MSRNRGAHLGLGSFRLDLAKLDVLEGVSLDRHRDIGQSASYDPCYTADSCKAQLEIALQPWEIHTIGSGPHLLEHVDSPSSKNTCV